MGALSQLCMLMKLCTLLFSSHAWPKWNVEVCAQLAGSVDIAFSSKKIIRIRLGESVSAKSAKMNDKQWLAISDI